MIVTILGFARDPEHWAHPDKFYPEHFLDEEGQYIRNKEGFVPYGTGLALTGSTGQPSTRLKPLSFLLSSVS